MMSKNSFWASMVENSKRRIWVWALSLLTFVLALPTYVAFSVNRQAGQLDMYVKNYGQKLGEQMVQRNIQEAVEYCLSYSTILMIMVAGLAFLVGVQGFSWLYSRKKIDFYMGMPIKRKKRFLVIWLNGILIFGVPYLLGVAVSLLIAAANGGISGSVLGSVAVAAGMNLLLYLGVYHLAILAVMMTGNIVITACGFGVFCLYEYMVRSILYSYSSLFFEHFSYQSTDVEPMLSPFILYYDFSVALKRGSGWLGLLIGMIVFVAVIGVISYICYLKRPAEAAGKAMTFSVSKPVIKILLMVPVALFAGYLMAESVNYRPTSSQDGIGFVIFTLVVAVIVGCALMQVIYEFDIKGAFHKKSHIVISGVAVALIFLVFRYDLLEYDSYVPNPEKVESVAFIPSTYEAAAGYSSHVDEWGDYVSNWEYAKENMFLADVEAVCELAQLSMDEYEQMKRWAESMDLDEDELYTGETEEEYYWSYASVIYRMKNGREVCREFKINVKNEEAVAYLDRIIGEPEFKTGYLDGASDTLIALLENNDRYTVEAFYGNTVYNSKMSRQDAAEFVKVYQSELKDADFSDLRESVPVGVLLIDVTQTNRNGGRWTRTIGINVYEFMEASTSYLEEKGYYLDAHLNPEDVERIQIVNYNNEARKLLEEKQKMQTGAAGLEETVTQVSSVRYQMVETNVTDTSVYVDYTEPEQIAAIAEMLYPNDLIGYEWDGGTPRDDEYEVHVYFKNGNKISKEYGITAYYGFIEGQVPEFVQADTAYTE
ncbi:MAG: hypothetical protein IJ409_10325 [Lachnospiraceae bacterium]|nr:hypothetical protein [Lachnospiraceae bacterium]